MTSPTPQSVHAQSDKLLETMTTNCRPWPSTSTQRAPDVLAFTSSPKQIWRQIGSDNPNERLNREIGPHGDV